MDSVGNKSEKNYGFEACNDIGKNGEYLIAELFPKTFSLTDGMQGDLLLKDKYKFELKTDTYDSGNFFFEKISNVRLNNVGGVWQTKEHGCEYYSFLMLEFNKLFIFEVDIILKWLNENATNYRSAIVNNPTKQTKGYVIPMKDVEHLCIQTIDLIKVDKYSELKEKYKFDELIKKQKQKRKN